MPIKKGSTDFCPAKTSEVYVGNKLVWENVKEKVVKDVTTLTVNDALARPVKALTRFGKCTQPAAPMYSTITQRGKCERRNLPRGYTELEYIEIDTVGTNGVWFPTGVTAGLDAEIEITASNVTSASSQLAVARCQSGADYFRVAKATATQRIVGTIGAQTLTATGVDGLAKFHAKLNREGFWVNGQKIGNFTTSSLTGVGEIDLLRGVYGANIYYPITGTRLHDALVRNASQTFDVVACRRDSDNALGLYDYASNAFVPPQGNGSLTAGPEVTAPSPEHSVDIWCNNGVLRVKNLFDYEYFYDNYQTQPNSTVGRCPIKLKPNTAYTVSTNKNTSAGNSAIFVVSGKDIYWSPSTANNGVLANSPRTVTTDSNGYLCFGIYVRDVNAIPESDFTNGTVWAQIEQGTTATPYMPYGQIYVDGTPETLTVGNQTVSVADLFAVGDYADTHEIIGGQKQRECGTVALTGAASEDWQRDTYGGFQRFYLPQTARRAQSVLMLTRYTSTVADGQRITPGNAYISSTGALVIYTTANQPTMTVEEWRALLAGWLADGKPLMGVIPVAPSTEQLTPADIVRTYPQTITATTNVGDVTITETHVYVTTASPRTPLPIWCNNGKLVYSNGAVVPDGTPETLTIGGGSRAPDGWTEVEYIESDGTAYAITPAILPQKSEFHLDFQFTDEGTEKLQNAWGGASSADHSNIDIQRKKSVSPQRLAVSFTSSYRYAYFSPDFSSRLALDATVGTDSFTAVLNGETKTVSGNTGQSGVESALFAYLQSGSGGNLCSGRLYSAWHKITETGAYDFYAIPVKNDTTGEYAIYDSANDTIIHAAEGTFTGGAAVSPSGQTVSVADLLGISDNYTDRHEIIEGIKTGKVGIVRLSPDWTWLKSSTYIGSFYTNSVTGTGKKQNDPTALCTNGFSVNSLSEYSEAGVGAFYWYSVGTINYKFDDGSATVEQFVQFLTDNVVLVLFPRATETTEQLTPQPLNMAKGTNTLSSESELGTVVDVELKYYVKRIVT